jgi:D-cysteine desulfhydrase
MEPELHRALPRAQGEIPWLSLGTYPTRVERIDSLFPGAPELWVKREDEGGSRYGGNKLRKLEFMLGAARAAGKKHLVTFGGYGSHHVAATAIYAKGAGFTVEAALFPQPVDDHVREHLLADQGAGAKLVPVSSMAYVLPERLRAMRDRDAQWLAGGGSSVAGTLGYVSAGFEILAQVRAGELPPFDAVYVAVGSCGTYVGLAWSLWSPTQIELVGVSVLGGWMSPELRARKLQRSLERRLVTIGEGARRGSPPRARIERRFGGTFGLPTPESIEATRVGRDAGIPLEPIYTGKVMAALLAHAREGRLRGKRVLFLHTHNTCDLSDLVARSGGVAALPASLARALTT